VLAAALALAALSIGATVHRSLIPVGLDGTVQQVEVRREKHPGVVDVWLIHVGQRQLHVDAAMARRLPEGTTVAKRAWSRTLIADGRPIRLGLSRDAVGMLWVMPLAVAAVAAVMAFGVRGR
jgi:hypothetical protein